MATIKKKSAPQKKRQQKKVSPKSEVIIMPKVVEPVWRPIDFKKVKTINDVKLILEHMSLGCWDNAPAYYLLKKFLKDDE